MTTLNPYLSFNGTCEAAFTLYKSVFGGSFDGICRYGDLSSEYPVPESEKNKVVHMSLRVGNVTLMGADSSDAFGQKTVTGDNVAVSINVGSADEAKRVYNALSQGGKVIMPLEKTFWADLYALFVDPFGVSWMVNYSSEMCPCGCGKTKAECDCGPDCDCGCNSGKSGSCGCE